MLNTCICISQDVLRKYNKTLEKHRMVLNINDTTLEFETSANYETRRINLKKRYYWYKQNQIKSTEGGYDGRVLHGVFKKFDPDHNLIEKGEFKYGLKNAKWFYWKPNGDLETIVVWKKGKMKSSPKKIRKKNWLKIFKTGKKNKKANVEKKNPTPQPQGQPLKPKPLKPSEPETPLIPQKQTPKPLIKP